MCPSSNIAYGSKRVNVKTLDSLPKARDCTMFSRVSTGLGRITQNVSFSSKETSHVDVLIIGGGIMGSSAAYWIKKEAGEKLNVCVVEKDMTFRKCSTALSVGGIRQQFSNPENVLMSLFGIKFLREIEKHLHVDGFPEPDIGLKCEGYLVMASKEGAQILHDNSVLQNKLGAKNTLFSASQLAKKFPWINVSGIELACLGTEDEGWFDPWLLLSSFKRKAQSLGTAYESGEVVKINSVYSETRRITGVQVKLKDGNTRDVGTENLVIAAGAYSGKVAALAGIGTSSENADLAVPLPVEPRKRYVFGFRCPDGPKGQVPLTVDITGTYFRKEGAAGNYICGRSPNEEVEPSIDNLDVEENFFDTQVWPNLAERVPAFESLKVQNSWAGYYEYNTFDQNAVIGRHPCFSNLFISAGFSGHGIQHGAAAGLAIKELILQGGYKTLDLSRLGFERLLRSEKVLERNVV